MLPDANLAGVDAAPVAPVELAAINDGFGNGGSAGIPTIGLVVTLGTFVTDGVVVFFFLVVLVVVPVVACLLLFVVAAAAVDDDASFSAVFFRERGIFPQSGADVDAADSAGANVDMADSAGATAKAGGDDPADDAIAANSDDGAAAAAAAAATAPAVCELGGLSTTFSMPPRPSRLLAMLLKRFGWCCHMQTCQVDELLNVEVRSSLMEYLVEHVKMDLLQYHKQRRNWWQNNGSNINMHKSPIHLWRGRKTIQKLDKPYML